MPSRRSDTRTRSLLSPVRVELEPASLASPAVGRVGHPQVVEEEVGRLPRRPRRERSAPRLYASAAEGTRGSAPTSRRRAAEVDALQDRSQWYGAFVSMSPATIQS